MILGFIPAHEAQVILNLIIAAILGGLIGIEREAKQNFAGLRTLILVSVGAAMFTAAAIAAFGNGTDPASRIIANIAVGIGFLGSGAVLKQRDNVKGLTTAASIWAVAAISIAVMLNLYWLSIAAEVIVLITLFALRYLEERIPHVKEPSDE